MYLWTCSSVTYQLNSLDIGINLWLPSNLNVTILDIPFSISIFGSIIGKMIHIKLDTKCCGSVTYHRFIHLNGLSALSEGFLSNCNDGLH